MTSWSATEITTRIVDAADNYSLRNPQKLKQLHTALSHADPEEVYFGVMAVFRIPRFGPQEVAGRLLIGIKPRPREPLEVIVRNSLATWDLSVEELPWYFAEKFGAEEILSTLDALEIESTRSDQELVAIRSFRFWLPKCPTYAQPIIPLDLSRYTAPSQ